MKKILDKAKVFLAIGLTAALITTPWYVSSASDPDVYVDDRPDYLQGDESGGVLCYDVATGEVTYTSEADILSRPRKKDSAPASYDGQCFAEKEPEESEPQPYSFGNWYKVTNPNYDVNTRSTVKIVAHTKGGRIISGSGFMIGSHAVATCGHILCDYGYGEDRESWDWIEYAEIIPAFNSGSSPKPYGTAKSTKILCGRQWAKELDPEYDWGIIVLDSDIGDDCGWRAVWYQTQSLYDSKVKLNGYGDENDMYSCDTFITESETRMLYTGLTIARGGDSGGPCYKEINGVYKAIAIITSQAKDENGRITGTNFRRIDKSLYDELVYYRDA